ncbi:MAG: DsbA family protein [Proteobacteria bacterium]|nr:DsbA family protein [Pseudomonadota bacterium]
MCRLAKPGGVNYNRNVTTRSPKDIKRYVFPAFIAFAGVALGGASCNAKSAAGPEEANEARELANALDQAEGKNKPTASKSSAKTASQDPLPGVDVSKLDAKKKERFYKLVDQTLQSPCGKAHSLRKSVTSDQTCKRALFAARYVVALLDDEATDEDVRRYYEGHYKAKGNYNFETQNTPFSGAPDAPVKLVEFYDYGCPACKEYEPLLKEAVEPFSGEVVLYYKQFPLPVHPDSRPAAQAALAAQKQGKFEEMHRLLFEKSHQHKKSDLQAHAKALGLDMGKFETDFNAAAAVVQAHITEGDAAGVDGTPTLFINGRKYKGPWHPRYVRLWIEEELAVNR